MRTNIFLPLLILLACLVLLPATAQATEETVPEITAEPVAASNFIWYVEGNSLYIAGSGAIPDYTSASAAPWASYRSSVSNIYFDGNIQNIGSNAFSGFQTLGRIAIPDSVTRIGSNTFSNCPELTIVEYSPTYSAVIENSAFSGCTALTDLELGGNVCQIWPNAFYGCSSIAQIDFPDALTYIGDQAFAGCTGLKTMHLPGSILELGQRAFANCTGLEYIAFTGDAPYMFANTFASDSTPIRPVVSVPGNNDTWTDAKIDLLAFDTLFFADDNIVAEGRSGDVRWLFREDDYLIVYGEGDMASYDYVNPAPWSVFADRTAVLMVLDGVTSIGSDAFCEHFLLSAVQLPEGITTIGDGAFAQCIELTWFYNSVLEQALPNSLTDIGEQAFANCFRLYDLSFGPNLASIGRGAFLGTGLQNVTLPDSLGYTGELAFWSCDGLSSVSFPGAPLTIEARAFWDCTSLSSITFRGSAPQISGDVFGGNYTSCPTIVACYPENDSSWNATTKLDYGRSITWMPIPADLLGAGSCGDNLIWTLDREGTMTISGTGDMYDYSAGMVIGGGAFFAPWETLKNSITALVVEEGVTSIGRNAFYKCFYLEEVSLPDSLTKISEAAFFDCDSVTCFDIGKNVTDIGYYAFYGSDSFRGIWVDPENAFYASDDRGVLFNKSMTLLIRAPGGIGGIYTIPYGVTEIYEAAFDNCTQLEGVTIPSTVTTIRQFAFAGCFSLTYVDIPASVTTIDRCAFWVCNHLTEIRFRGDAPTFGEDGIFTSVEAYVYYPEGNATWTEDKRQQYEGTLTWIPEEPEEPGYCVPGLNNAKFYTFEEAMAAYDPETQYIKLLKDNSIYTWLEKDLRIDLNGFSLHGELDPEGFRIYAIDTATDSYTAEDFGTFRCYDSYGEPVVPEQHVKTGAAVYGATKRYLAVEENGAWSFHRFYMGISHITFNPTHSGIGYRATFAGDPWVKSQLAADSGYGIQLSLDADFENSVEAAFPAVTFPADGTAQRRSALLENILTPDMPPSQQKTNGNAIVYVRVFLTLSDGSRICTGRTGISMSLLLRNIGTNYKNYTAAQQLRLQAFLRTYPELCKEWNFLQNVA